MTPGATPTTAHPWHLGAWMGVGLCLAAQALAQSGPTPLDATAGAANPGAGWQACTALAADAARLACFDRWARSPGRLPMTPPDPRPTPMPSSAFASPAVAHTAPERSVSGPPATPSANLPPHRSVQLTTEDGCKDRRQSDLSRFWELDNGSNCGTFGIRGYRPLSLSLIASDSVNQRPTSPGPNNTVAMPSNFSRRETRVQLSVRTKIAQGLLTGGHPTHNDSLWFGYTQQSYWQLFNKALSRPFRSTDHEPELVYVYPTETTLPGGWRLRYGGLGVSHQSNGQSEPLSRSWNRAYLMAGLEKDQRFRIQARAWRRIPENRATDDNPDISDFIGRAEVTGWWNVNADNLLGVTVRHALRGTDRGSARLEWYKTLGQGGHHQDPGGLRLHTQLFTGYGDSLVDYNRKRTVLSVGLSLVDW